jgi:LacI family repressor for deo operon, udp, cdd, tsx, nupC, and nupG
VDVVLGASFAPGNLFCMRLLATIEQKLSREGYDCVVRTHDGGYDGFLSLCEALRTSDAAGTALIGYFPLDETQTLLDIAPDAVLLDYTGHPGLRLRYESIAFDNVEAARLAVRHLVDIGRRRIALLRGPQEHFFSRDVEMGYLEVLRDAGLTTDNDLILEADFSPERAGAILREALESGQDIDAVFTNDEMAVGLLRVLHDMGRNVPGDIAVAGCDGLPIGLHTIPSLTTVIMDYRKMGELAVRRILDRRPSFASEQHIRLRPVLEVRESTAGPA